MKRRLGKDVFDYASRKPAGALILLEYDIHLGSRSDVCSLLSIHMPLKDITSLGITRKDILFLDQDQRRSAVESRRIVSLDLLS